MLLAHPWLKLVQFKHIVVELISQVGHLDVGWAGTLARPTAYAAPSLVESSDNVPGLPTAGRDHAFCPAGRGVIHEALYAIAHWARFAAGVATDASLGLPDKGRMALLWRQRLECGSESVCPGEVALGYGLTQDDVGSNRVPVQAARTGFVEQIPAIETVLSVSSRDNDLFFFLNRPKNILAHLTLNLAPVQDSDARDSN